MSLLSVPLKSIIAWHADLQNDTPPLEYAICDGRTLNSSQQDINPGSSYTVPDLRNVFLIGADLTKTTSSAGVAVGNANINNGAGAPGPKGTGGENQHQITQAELAAHTHTDSGHTHPIPAQGAVSGPAAGAWVDGSGKQTSTGFANIQNTGGDQPHENRPKYYGVVYIMKVKN